MTDRAILWARSGVVWLLLTMAAGLHIGITGQLGASSHHAHMGLLGGIWQMAFGFLFNGNGKPLDGAGKVQWALYNLGVAIMAVSLYMVVREGGAWGMVIGVGGIVVLVATLWIVATVWPRRA